MRSAYEVAGRIRESLAEIVADYDVVLIPQRTTSGVKLPTDTAEGEKMRFARRPSVGSTMPLNEAVLDARRACHEDLLHFSRSVLMMCVDVNGDAITTRVDHDSIPALCEFLSTWAFPLADIDAGEALLCEQDMAKHASKLHGLAYPPRQDSILLGPCPMTVADSDGMPVVCGRKVRAFAEQPQVSCPGCGTTDTVDWWMSQIVGNGEAKDLVTADELISIIARTTEQVLTHQQIRQWATRNKIPRSGKDAKGRTLYDHMVVLAVVKEAAAKVG